jgi:hypothetical protein
MSHVLFPEFQFTLWHDGSHHLMVNPWEIIDCAFAGEMAFATFKHPKRDCLYQETEACITLKKDRPEILLEQSRRYARDGYPARRGLFETSCVARRNCDAVSHLNQLWWREIQHGSCRDQISLPYAMWKSAFTQLILLSGSRDRSTYFAFKPHR